MADSAGAPLLAGIPEEEAVAAAASPPEESGASVVGGRASRSPSRVRRQSTTFDAEESAYRHKSAIEEANEHAGQVEVPHNFCQATTVLALWEQLDFGRDEDIPPHVQRHLKPKRVWFMIWALLLTLFQILAIAAYVAGVIQVSCGETESCHQGTYCRVDKNASGADQNIRGLSYGVCRGCPNDLFASSDLVAANTTVAAKSRQSFGQCRGYYANAEGCDFIELCTQMYAYEQETYLRDRTANRHNASFTSSAQLYDVPSQVPGCGYLAGYRMNLTKTRVDGSFDTPAMMFAGGNPFTEHKWLTDCENRLEWMASACDHCKTQGEKYVSYANVVYFRVMNMKSLEWCMFTAVILSIVLRVMVDLREVMVIEMTRQTAIKRAKLWREQQYAEDSSARRCCHRCRATWLDDWVPDWWHVALLCLMALKNCVNVPLVVVSAPLMAIYRGANAVNTALSTVGILFTIELDNIVFESALGDRTRKYLEEFGA